MGAKLALPFPGLGGKARSVKLLLHNPANPISCGGFLAFRSSGVPWCAAGKMNFGVPPPCPDTPGHCRDPFVLSSQSRVYRERFAGGNVSSG